jgi:hypothetical protein
MAVRTPTRRRQKRYPVGHGTPAHVAFDFPNPGGLPRRLALVNFSKSGVSFRLEGNDDLAQLDPGSRLDAVVLEFGDCTIQGELLVMHVTPDSRSHALCGALFYPATDVDLIKLRSVVAGMEAVTPEE